MRMPDVNILLHAHRPVLPEHQHYADWLTRLVDGEEPFGISEPVVHSVVRIATGHRVFNPPSTVKQAFDFLDELLESPNCTLVRPGPRHLEIFRQLCSLPGVRGNLVADAAHAALAIEYGCVWCSADTDFKRFEPMLRWEHV